MKYQVDAAVLERLWGVFHRASLRGDFKLASGATSGFYFDCRKVTLWPEGASLTGKVIAQVLAQADVDAVGGLAMGAIAPSVAAMLEAHRPVSAFYVRDERKEHGTRTLVEWGLRDEELPISQRKVAVLDDVVTKGGSILKAIHAVEEEGCLVSLVLTLVDRGEGGRETLSKKGHHLVAIFESDKEGNLKVGRDIVPVAQEPSKGVLRRQSA